VVTTVRIPVHLRDEALSANGRQHWRVRATRARILRNKSRLMHASAAREVGQLHPQRLHLTVHVTWPDRRRRDVANLSPTIKALVDGAIDAHVLPDDDDRHLIGPDLRVAQAVTDAPGLAVLVFEWAAAPAPPVDANASTQPIERAGR